jgi:hypothetical protein
MRFKAHRRPGDHGRLESQLERGRATAQRTGRTTGPTALPGRSPGRLVGDWTVNDSGRLVMVWSLVPPAPDGDVPWATVRLPSPRAGARLP